MTCFRSRTGHPRLQGHLLIWGRNKRKCSYELLHCCFPVGENTFFGPLPTESSGKVLVNCRTPDLSSKISQYLRSVSQVFCVWYVHLANYFSDGNKGAVLKYWFKMPFVLPTVLIISDSQNYLLPTFEIADRTGDHSIVAFGVQAAVFHAVIGLLFLEIIAQNIWKFWNLLLRKKSGRCTKYTCCR